MVEGEDVRMAWREDGVEETGGVVLVGVIAGHPILSDLSAELF